MCFTTVFTTFPRRIYANFATFPSISSSKILLRYRSHWEIALIACV
nr:MAG TPA: hypothetical protein [Caudoviricetes sp.]